MKGVVKFFCFIVLIQLVIGAPPIILKESSPSGQSVVAISSSDQTGKKYFASASASQSSNQGQGDSVQSFSIASPEKSISGTGRSFNTPSVNNPFFVPFLVSPNIEGIDLSWLRNLESFYGPKFSANGVTSVTAINDNGHVYGKINNIPFDNEAKNM